MLARILKRGHSYNRSLRHETFNFPQGPHSKLYHAPRREHLDPAVLMPVLRCLALSAPRLARAAAADKVPFVWQPIKNIQRVFHAMVQNKGAQVATGATGEASAAPFNILPEFQR